jgi:uncharacterized protein YggE
MKKLLYLVLAAGLVFALVGCQKTKIIEEGIVLNGTGAVLATPDTADFNITIKTKGSKTDREKVIGDNAQKTDSVRRALLKNEIKEKEISTDSFDAREVAIYNSKGNITSKQFVVNNVLNIKTTNIKKVSGLLGKLLLSGATSIGELNYSFSNSAKLEAQAYALAVKDAKVKAAAVADAGGVKLLSISNVNVSNPSSNYGLAFNLRKSLGYYEGQNEVSTYIYTAPKPQNIKANIEVTFAIERR